MEVSLRDGIFRNEYTLTIVRGVAWFGRGTKRINIPAVFGARRHCVRTYHRDGSTEHETFPCRKERVRCCSSRHHRFHAGTCYQWLSAFFSYARQRIPFGVTTSGFESRGVLFTCFWNRSERNAGGAGTERQIATQKHALEPHF